MIIAIDGPAGSGKSTVAREVARRLGFTYLDSGAMYRAVTLAALEAGADITDGPALGRLGSALDIELHRRDDDNARVIADGRDVSDAIRDPRVTGASSTVAAHPEVRAAMLEKQRALMAAGDYVVEGRDIGTVVAPDADVKVFLTAAPGARAERRNLELRSSVDSVESTASDLARRDAQDSSRPVSPLTRAADAVEIDTTTMSADEAVEAILRLVQARTGGQP